MKGVTKAALYMRLSKDDEQFGDSISIETQRSILSHFVKEHGFSVFDEYVDDGWTGTNFDRPNFKRMMDDMESGKINCIVTKDLSRFGREHIQTDFYIECIFPEKSVRFIAIHDNVDTANGVSDLVAIKNLFKNKRCLGGGTTKGSFMNFQMDKLQVLLHTAFTRPDRQSGKTL